MILLKRNVFTIVEFASSKISCVIFQIVNSSIKILSFSTGSASGLKNGTVSDISLAVKSVGQVVSKAELQYGKTIESVFVIVSGCDVDSEIITQEAFVNDREITEKDIKNLLSRSISSFEESRLIIHSVNNGYALDNLLVSDPIGMSASKIVVSTNFISVSKSKLTNVNRVFSQCRLTITGYIASPYADSFSCLTEDDKNIGSTLINFGSGNTSVVTFKSGSLVSCYSKSIGSEYITFDIAFAFGVSLVNAEKLKILHGSLFPDEEGGVIIIPNDDENSEISIDYTEFLAVIKARQEEILESVLLSKKIEQGCRQISVRKILITGGGSSILGLDKLIKSIFPSKIIREAEYLNVEGIDFGSTTLNKTGTMSSTIIGSIKYVQQKIFTHEEIEERKKFNFKKVFSFFSDKA